MKIVIFKPQIKLPKYIMELLRCPICKKKVELTDRSIRCAELKYGAMLSIYICCCLISINI